MYEPLTLGWFLEVIRDRLEEIGETNAQPYFEEFNDILNANIRRYQIEFNPDDSIHPFKNTMNLFREYRQLEAAGLNLLTLKLELKELLDSISTRKHG
jgi:hypothetical protein